MEDISSNERVKTYYEILEVDETVDDLTIRKAFKRLALQWHPDKNPGNEAVAEERFKEIGAAYEVLHDPEKRREYDIFLASRNVQPSPSNFSESEEEEQPTYAPKFHSDSSEVTKEQVEELLKQVTEFLERTAQLGQELLNEARAGNWARLDELIAQGAGLSERDGQGNTVLHHAVLQRNQHIVLRLLSVQGFWVGANVSSANYNGDTPLHIAVTSGLVNIIELLLNAGAKLSCKDGKGRTPLHIAILFASGPQWELFNWIAGMLISKGKKEGFWFFAKESNETASDILGAPLALALKSKNFFLVEKLFRAGVKIDDESERMLHPICLNTENPRVANLMIRMIEHNQALKKQELETKKDSWCRVM